MSRRRPLPQCVECGAPGIGDPPLCAFHFSTVDDVDFEADDEAAVWSRAQRRPNANPAPGHKIDLMTAILQHPESAALIETLVGKAREFFRQTVTPGGGYQAECPPPPPGGEKRRRRNAPPSDGSAPTRMSADEARISLGFAPGQPLSEAVLRQRRRALTAMFHPDAGGSDEAMKRLNQAVAMLLDELR